MEPRTLSSIIADLIDTLQAGSVSSQLDAATVATFAAQSLQALASISATLDAIDSDTIAAAVADALELADKVLVVQSNVAGASTMLDGIKRDAADAAAQLDAVRAELADIRGQLAELKPA